MKPSLEVQVTQRIELHPAYDIEKETEEAWLSQGRVVGGEFFFAPAPQTVMMMASWTGVSFNEPCRVCLQMDIRCSLLTQTFGPWLMRNAVEAFLHCISN